MLDFFYMLCEYTNYHIHFLELAGQKQQQKKKNQLEPAIQLAMPHQLGNNTTNSLFELLPHQMSVLIWAKEAWELSLFLLKIFGAMK